MDFVLQGGKKSGKSKKSPADKKTSKSKGKKSPSAPKKKNPWLEHVKKTMKEKPNMKFAEILVLCKKTYKK